MSQPKGVVNGYGSVVLLGQVRKWGWVDCSPPDTGKNFMGIEIGGYVLTDSADPLCPVKFRVTLECLTTGKKFEVSGYCYKEIVAALEQNQITIGNVTFAGQNLRSDRQPHLCRFRATIEVIK